MAPPPERPVSLARGARRKTHREGKSFSSCVGAGTSQLIGSRHTRRSAAPDGAPQDVDVLDQIASIGAAPRLLVSMRRCPSNVSGFFTTVSPPHTVVGSGPQTRWRVVVPFARVTGQCRMPVNGTSEAQRPAHHRSAGQNIPVQPPIGDPPARSGVANDPRRNKRINPSSAIDRTVIPTRASHRRFFLL